MARLNPLKNFTTGKIGSGRLFSAGSLTSRHRRGLAGALRSFKTDGRHSYSKNLSTKDIETFHGLIGEEMSKLTTHSQGLGYRARRRIMQEAETLRKKGKLSRADKTDLKSILAAMSPSASGGTEEMPSTEPRQRAVAFGGSSRVTGSNAEEESYINPEAQKHIKAGIQLGNQREMDAEDRGESHLDYDPRSELGRHQAIQNKRRNTKQNTQRGKKIELQDEEDLVEMDIG